jgi:hypothetical protein
MQLGWSSACVQSSAIEQQRQMATASFLKKKYENTMSTAANSVSGLASG